MCSFSLACFSHLPYRPSSQLCQPRRWPVCCLYNGLTEFLLLLLSLSLLSIQSWLFPPKALITLLKEIQAVLSRQCPGSHPCSCFCWASCSEHTCALALCISQTPSVTTPPCLLTSCLHLYSKANTCVPVHLEQSGSLESWVRFMDGTHFVQEYQSIAWHLQDLQTPATGWPLRSWRF